MDERKQSLLLFEGNIDVTLTEVEVWKTVLHSIAAGNELYVRKLREAKDILAAFCSIKIQYEHTGNNAMPAAQRFIQLLSTMAAFHQQALGDMESFTDPEGPFGNLIGLSDKVFDQIQKASEFHLKQHKKLEKSTAQAWKYYKRRVKKKQKLCKKLSKTLPSNQAEEDKKLCRFTRKVDEAFFQYNAKYEHEFKKRDVLAQNTEYLRKDFLKEEKHKLDVMFASINDLLERMERVASRDLKLPDDVDFEPEVPNTKAMARDGWQDRLYSYTFPQQKNSEDVTRQGDEEEDNYSDEGENGDNSDDDLDDDKDVSPARKIVTREDRTKDSHLPARHRTNIDDALKEILESLGESPRGKSRQEPRDTSHGSSTTHEHKSGSDTSTDVSSGDKSTHHQRSKKMYKAHGRNLNQPTGNIDARQRRRSGQHKTGEVSQRNRDEEGESETVISDLTTGKNYEPKPKIAEAKENYVCEQKDFYKTSNTCRVALMRNITVKVLRKREKKSSDEISLRIGMRIRQTRSVDSSGMAYGYKISKLGFKRYGYYPASHVAFWDYDDIE